MPTDVAYRIYNAREDDLQRSIAQAPKYDAKIASALSRVIKAIHGLADLHKNKKVSLKQIEVYLGRSSDLPKHLKLRWQQHRNEKKHQHGIVLFKCEPDQAEYLEEIGIRVVRKLKGYNTLCVGNVNIRDKAGRPPDSSSTAVIYMTWRTKSKPAGYERPSSPIIKRVASEVASELNKVTPQQKVTSQQLEKGLKASRSEKTQKAKLDWDPD